MSFGVDFGPSGLGLPFLVAQLQIYLRLQFPQECCEFPRCLHLGDNLASGPGIGLLGQYLAW